MDDLKTGRLAAIMQRALQQEGEKAVTIDLNGAACTARWLERLNERGPGGLQG